MSQAEIRKFFTIHKKIERAGRILIFISHRLEEVFELADKIIVLKDGEKVAELNTEETNEKEVIRLMVGREYSDFYQRERKCHGDVCLELKDISGVKEGMLNNAYIPQHVSFKVEEGEVLGVAGLVGAGRTELVRMIFGEMPIGSGEIFVQGEQVSSLDEDGWNKLRQKMGMVFQYSALFDFLTVGENVAFGLRQHTDKSESEIQGIVDEMLELVGLPQSKEQYPAELSGGMKKRVGLARAIANRPEIVLYDEPTAGLDPIMSNNISRLIRKTQQQLQVTSVLVTHDMESAFYAADRIAMLYKGKIVALGTVEEIRNGHNQIVDAFIRGKEIREEAVQ